MLSLLTNTDRELLERMQADDEQAFTQFFHRYWEELYIAAGKRLGNVSETKDIVQEIMTSIWVRRHAINTNDEGSLKPYLYTLLRYRIFDAIAHDRRMEITYNVFQQVLSLQESHVLEEVISKELFNLIHQEIEAMPVTMKKVMQMSQRRGYSVAEIADRLALSEKTVRNLTSIAFTRIRACVTRYYADGSPSSSSSTQAVFVLIVLYLMGI
jgi:RNA polymerase sigma-70 factor (ECF subfamily)